MTEKRNTQPTEITAQGYFAVIPDWVADLPMSRAALCVYISLRRYADNTTGECWPSRRTLAARSQISVDTLDRAIRELVAQHAISITRRKNEKGEWTSSLYTVMTLPLGVAANLLPPSRKSPTRGSRKSPTRTISSTNDNHEHTTKIDFDLLWAIYPRKVAKAAAWRAWQKVMSDTNPPALDLVNAAIVEYATTITEMRYCAHMATWLSQQRWNDVEISMPIPVRRREPRIDDAMSLGAALAHTGRPESELIESMMHRPPDEQAAALDLYRQISARHQSR